MTNERTKDRVAVIAGPVAIDDLPDHPGLLGGGGVHAAAAAAGLVTTQLWARAGAAFPPLAQFLERRGIDLSGVSDDGDSARWQAATRTWTCDGPILPEAEPTSAPGVTALALVHLPPAEAERAISCFARLAGASQRTLVVAPHVSTIRDHTEHLHALARHQAVIVLPIAAATAALDPEPLTAARQLRASGATAVVLTAGATGGLVLYKDKATTWPAAPVEPKEATGCSSAFVGALAGWLAMTGKCDFRALKRALWTASAVAAQSLLAPGPKRTLGLSEADISQGFTRLRRITKA